MTPLIDWPSIPMPMTQCRNAVLSCLTNPEWSVKVVLCRYGGARTLLNFLRWIFLLFTLTLADVTAHSEFFLWIFYTKKMRTHLWIFTQKADKNARQLTYQIWLWNFMEPPAIDFYSGPLSKPEWHRGPSSPILEHSSLAWYFLWSR